MFIDFQTNHLVTVETKEPGLWSIISRFDDSLFSAELLLDVRLPALDIVSASVNIRRDDLGLVPDLSEAFARLVGVRVGPGMTKIVRGVLGGPQGSARVAELVLEAMEMLVNALTLPELRKAAESAGRSLKHDKDGPKIYLNNVVIGGEAVKIMGQNPRLKDSCAAFKGD